MLLFGIDQSRGWPRVQGHVTLLRSLFELGGQVAYQSDLGVQYEHNGDFPDSLSSFERKLLTTNADDPKGPLWRYLWLHTKSNMKNKVRTHTSSVWQQYLMCLNSDYIIYVAKWAISVFPIGSCLMGEVTWLTWPQITYMKNPRQTKCEHPGAGYFLKVVSSWERLPAICSAVNFRHSVTVRRFTYDVIGQWPVRTWK